MATNLTWMAEGGAVWKQRFIPKVTDPDLITEALEACANTHLLTKTAKEWGGLKGELLVAWCEARLEPGRAWSNTAVTLWSPLREPERFSGYQVVAIMTAGVLTILLYTGRIPSDVRIPAIGMPIAIQTRASMGRIALRKLARCFIPGPSETLSVESHTISFIRASLGEKRKLEPDADKYDKKFLRPSKRAKTEGFPEAGKNDEKYLSRFKRVKSEPLREADEHEKQILHRSKRAESEG